MRQTTLARLLLITGLSLLDSAVHPAQAQENLAAELPRIPARPPQEALASFVLREGFTLLEAASEPAVADPVSACYDADGRLYVVEMRGYPFPEPRPTGKVRLLHDDDGDGRFDRSTDFLDDLNWPTSVVPSQRGVFVMAPPDLLFARDDDGDGLADSKRVVFTGFGTQNVQALANGLLWGPDGWIYGVGGGNGGDIENPARPEAGKVSIRGRDFRFRPDGSKFEAISGGGQFGHSFDDYGRRFTCNNSNHIRQIVFPRKELDRNPTLAGIPVLTDIGAEGAAAPVFRISRAEPWRLVRTRQRASDPDFRRRLPPTELVATGFFTSATGVTIYRGHAFPTEYQGNAFIGDVGGNLVHRKRLEPAGAVLRAVRTEPDREFLASPDNWFRPVNFANTPWGTLLILDMYRETIEHPLSIPEPIKQHLDLVSGKDRGRLYELIPDNFHRRQPPHLSSASTDELVATLADPDAWYRETAMRLLLEQNDPSARPALEKLVAESPQPLARLHAIWTLNASGELKPSILVAGLTDTASGVREAAARLVVERGDLATNDQVAQVVIALAQDPDPMVRFAAAQALGEIPGPDALTALAAIAAQDAQDRWTRAAVLSSLGGKHDPGALLSRLGQNPDFLVTSSGQVWLDELSALVGARNQPQEINILVSAHKAAPPAQVRALLLGLGRGLSRAGRRLDLVLTGDAKEVLSDAINQAIRTADEPGSEAEVDGAVQLLALADPARALEVLPGLLEAHRGARVQLSVLRALSSFKTPAVADHIIERWGQLGPAARGEALEALLARPDRVRRLLKAVADDQIAVVEIDPARRQRLLAHPDPAIQALAKEALGNPARPDRASVLAAYSPALTLPAKPERGLEVFQKVCATCHLAQGQGVAVGPALETVANRTPEDLLLHILDPNREIAPAYLNYTLATTDGRVLSGMIAEESSSAVTLIRAQGASDLVPRDQIEELRSTGQSLMPENLETLVDPQSMGDLISYLRQLQPQPPANR